MKRISLLVCLLLCVACFLPSCKTDDGIMYDFPSLRITRYCEIEDSAWKDLSLSLDIASYTITDEDVMDYMHEMQACTHICIHAGSRGLQDSPPHSSHTPHSYTQACKLHIPVTLVHMCIAGYTYQGHSCSLAQPWPHSETYQGTQEETRPQPFPGTV